jgi:hypothetical protein
VRLLISTGSLAKMEDYSFTSTRDELLTPQLGPLSGMGKPGQLARNVFPIWSVSLPAGAKVAALVMS